MNMRGPGGIIGVIVVIVVIFLLVNIRDKDEVGYTCVVVVDGTS